MLIQAKYSSACVRCSKSIGPGEVVSFEPETGTICDGCRRLIAEAEQRDYTLGMELLQLCGVRSGRVWDHDVLAAAMSFGVAAQFRDQGKAVTVERYKLRGVPLAVQTVRLPDGGSIEYLWGPADLIEAAVARRSRPAAPAKEDGKRSTPAEKTSPKTTSAPPEPDAIVVDPLPDPADDPKFRASKKSEPDLARQGLVIGIDKPTGLFFARIAPEATKTRDALADAGFRFHVGSDPAEGEKKCHNRCLACIAHLQDHIWYTRNTRVARRFLRYLDPEARQVAEDSRTAFEDSRAASANIAVPVRKGLSYYPYQLAGVRWCTERPSVLLADEPGCVEGDAVLRVNRACKGFRVKLRDAYRRFNGLGRANHNWDTSIPTYFRALCDGVLRQHKVKEIISKGVLPVVRVTLEDGKTIRVTPDHEIEIEGGAWVEAGKLKPGDVAITNGTPICNVCGKPGDIATARYAKHKGACKRCIQTELRTKRGSVEAQPLTILEGVTVCNVCGKPDDVVTYWYSKFRGSCRKCIYTHLRAKPRYKTGKWKDQDGYIIVSGIKDHPRAVKGSGGSVYEHILVMEKILGRYLTRQEDVHHKNGVKDDNRPENLEVLTRSEHHKRHNKFLNMNGGIGGNGGAIEFIPKTSKVVSVEPAGFTDVYDVIMEDPHRNFVANGFVVHNCGKTIQVLGLMNADETIKRTLVICPASLTLNWRDEAKRWLVRPSSIQVLTNAASIPTSERTLAITNFEMLIRGRGGNLYGALLSQAWDLIAVDEAHRLCNQHEAKISQAVLGIPPKRLLNGTKTLPVPGILSRAMRRILATGTPFRNRPREMWPLIHALDPVHFADEHKFLERYCGGEEHHRGRRKFDGASHLDELQDSLRSKSNGGKGMMIRRLKIDVLPELPPKTRQIIALPVPKSAAKLVNIELKNYAKDRSDIEAALAMADMMALRGLHMEYRSAVDKLHAAGKIAFNRIAALRHDVGRAKAPVAVEHISSMLDGGLECVLVFAHHHDVIDCMVEGLSKYNPVKITGRESKQQKHDAVHRFQNDTSCRVVVGNIAAAGEGITLHRASTVVICELTFVPGQIEQVEDRAHRIGQRSAVLVQHLVFDGSVDQRIVKILVEKTGMSEQALDIEQVGAGQFSAEALKQAAEQRLRRNYPEEVREVAQRAIAGIVGFKPAWAPVGNWLAMQSVLNDWQCDLALRCLRHHRKQIPDQLKAQLVLQKKSP